MFHLFLLIMSYGAFLLSLMPATGEGIIVTAAALIIGIGLIFYKKIHKVTFLKNKQYFLVPFVGLVAAASGFSFYNCWLPSSKIRAIASVINIPVEMILLAGSLILSVMSVYFICVALQIIAKKLSDTNPKNDFKKSLISCIIVSVITVILSQVMAGAGWLSMGYLNFICCVLIVSAVILLIYCLIGRIIPSIISGSVLFMIISTINAYVYSFRGRLFEPVDIYSAGTAMNVADNYSLLPVPSGVIIGWGALVATLIFLCYLLHKSKPKLTAKRRYILLTVCIIISVAISFYTNSFKTYHWHNEGAQFNGYILDFVSKFKEIATPKPDNYSTELIDGIASQYTTDSNPESSERPHIIVIMDEAFSDLSVAGEFSTNTEVMPFISSLKENTISGYALASVYGGNTANSEYEFLTGNSLAWLSPNAVPYQQYVRSSTYSMVSYLKSLYNYKCLAMHPFEASGWNRPTAYRHLGFDECYFVEDFPQKNYVREYISDREMFEFLTETFELQKENPLFIFGVTMQNHGGYTYNGENYNQHISLTDYEDTYPDVEQYLSLIYETDKAVEYLISYFENTDEKVVIVFFGDHQPKINESFYETIGKSADTLDGQQKRYAVPFFVWANYDIEEKYIERTSLNYLSSYVYDVAGITLPPYNQFLRDMEKEIPSINANGFYSLSAGCYLPFDEANKDEQQWLNSYEALQYNSIFDTTHQNETLFPIWE